MTNTPGWAIKLDGDPIDIGDLRVLLPPPYDPWIEDYATDDGLNAILRSKSWAGITEASVIFDDASRILERLHGELLLIHGDAKPVKPATVMSFGSDGKRENILYAMSASIVLSLGRVRMRAYATTGAPVEPSETMVQRWFREAEADDKRSDLFLHLTRLDNWFDLFKSMEIMRRMMGQPKLNSILSGEQKRWGAIWQTANCHRHAPDTVKFPLRGRAAIMYDL
jgi:hypothetical protein